MSDQDLLILLSVILAVVVVAVLAAALILVRRSLRRTSEGLATLASALEGVESIARSAAAGSQDLDAAALLLTTQEQVQQTVAGVANYGGSLDVILDDAPEEGR